jgi:nicotinamidase/pyrazinamidase
VKETVLDAAKAGFDVTVLVDGISAVDLTPGDGAKAVEEMAAVGAVIA